MSEGFDYVIDFADDDKPTVLTSNGKRIVALPPSYDINDQLIYARGRHAPSAYVDLFKRHLDVLLSESENTIMLPVFNAALYGHPAGGWALRECIRYAKPCAGVWITTHQACVQYWLEQNK